jgi:hypothetical protein
MKKMSPDRCPVGPARSERRGSGSCIWAPLSRSALIGIQWHIEASAGLNHAPCAGSSMDCCAHSPPVPPVTGQAPAQQCAAMTSGKVHCRWHGEDEDALPRHSRGQRANGALSTGLKPAAAPQRKPATQGRSDYTVSCSPPWSFDKRRAVGWYAVVLDCVKGTELPVWLKVAQCVCRVRRRRCTSEETSSVCGRAIPARGTIRLTSRQCRHGMSRCNQLSRLGRRCSSFTLSFRPLRLCRRPC